MWTVIAGPGIIDKGDAHFSVAQGNGSRSIKVIRYSSGVWECLGCQKGWKSEGGTDQPCDHIHCAFMHYARSMRRAQEMKQQLKKNLEPQLAEDPKRKRRIRLE